MSLTLDPQVWMTATDGRAVMAALDDAGGAGCARFVGGCVRNALMKKPVDDVDIATTLHPEAVIAALKAAGLKSVPTGLDHGTVTAISGGKPFEVTTLRRDVTTDGRNATVAFTDDWAQDAARRDFRFNALSDALAGRVVFVGDPETRIREDYLRILRFFRFFAWYGRGAPDEAALAACGALKSGMERLSAERVSKELLKLLAADDPRPAVTLMAQAGVLNEVCPQAENLERFAAVIEGGGSDNILRLAALLPDDGNAARVVAEELRLSNAQRNRLIACLSPGSPLSSTMTDAEARRVLYDIGAQTLSDRLRLARQDNPRLLDLAAAWDKPVLPAGGEDVAALGVPKGPMVGEILRLVEAWWRENDFPADRRKVLKKLTEVVDARL